MFSIKKQIKPQNNDFETDPKLCQIRHDIRNMKRLTTTQKEYIQTLSHDNKSYVIELYDDMMDWFIHFAENMWWFLPT